MKTNNLIATAAALMVLAGCATVKAVPWDASDASVHLPVALVSLETSQDPAANRAAIFSSIEEIMAAHPDVRLISFGEASVRPITDSSGMTPSMNAGTPPGALRSGSRLRAMEPPYS